MNRVWEQIAAFGRGPRSTFQRVTRSLPLPGAGRVWRRLSQPHYAIVLVAVLAAGLIASDRVSELQRARNDAEREATALATNLALALASDIESDLSAVDHTLETLAANLPLEPGYWVPGDEHVERQLLRRLRALTADLRGLYVFDDSGRFIHNTESKALLGADRSDRDYFRLGRESEGLIIGAPIRSRTNEELVLSLSRRIEGAGGQFIGVVSASLPLGRLEQFYARFDLHPSVAISFWHSDGILLARRPPALDLIGQPMPARRIQQAIEDGRRSGVAKAVSPIDGHIRLAAFRVLDRYPFAVTVAIQEDGYLADWRARWERAIREFIVLAAGLLSIALTFSILFHRRSLDRLAAEQKLHDALEELAASNHAKTMFLANMSHELRTPLNAIIGFSEMMRDERRGPAEPRHSEYAEHINSSGVHLLAVINDILDMTKIETGKWTLSLETLYVVREVQHVIGMVQPSAQDGGLAITEDLGSDALAMRGDRRALRQILLNILSNAIKFTPRGGQILVRVSATEDFATISVKDSGAGMARADLERIGRPFVRLGNPLTSRAGGTGLGLAISKSLAEMQGGQLAIESAVGAGTTVRLSFPLLRIGTIP